MHTILAHHDPNDPDFHAHILVIGGNAFCIGCSASKLFVHALLPILVVLTIFNGVGNWGLAEVGMGLGLVISGVITTIELKRGRPSQVQIVNAIPSAYLAASIVYVALSSTTLALSTRLILSVLLALPQMGLYLYKIVTTQEFTQRYIKLVVRLLFIIAFYFALVDISSSPLLLLGYIAIAAFIFMRLRKFSGYRVNSDNIAIITPNKLGQTVNQRLQDRQLTDHHGIVTSSNTLLIFVLFFIGLIHIVSLGEIGTCNNNLQSAAFSAPLIIGSSRPKFCPSCGDPVDKNEIFCDNCGTHLGGEQPAKQPYNQNQRSSQNRYNQQDNYSRQGYPQRGYQSGGYYGNRRGGYRRRSEITTGWIVGAGVVVFFLALFITADFFIAILAGLLASGGMYLASTTDNCCLQYLILDCCSDCICALIAGSSND